jgi:hypothetical protein
MVDKALELGNQVDSRLVRLGHHAGAGATALVRDIAVAARLDVVVGHVAAIGRLVPDAVALHVGAGRLAGDLDVGALAVGLLDAVVGAGPGAAVDRVAGDEVRAGGSQGGGESGDGEELHCCDFEGVLNQNEN